jgi:hypothetical protein
MMEFETINILEMLDAYSETEVKKRLAEYSCPLNPEIERFVTENAIEFAKKKMSITYLVVNPKGEIVAIFTLTHKAIELSNKELSNSKRKKISRYADLNSESDSYIVSAFLIAQFGKNYSYENAISGNDLMNLAMKALERVQREIGGGIVYLECEDKPELLGFYQNENNRFTIFDERYSKEDNTKYIQLYAIV